MSTQTTVVVLSESAGQHQIDLERLERCLGTKCRYWNKHRMPSVPIDSGKYLFLLDGYIRYVQWSGELSAWGDRGGASVFMAIYNIGRLPLASLSMVWRPELVALVKDDTFGAIERALNNVINRDGYWFPRAFESLLLTKLQMERQQPEHDQPVDLTDREKEILSLALSGSSNEQIASALNISVNTVKSHLHHSYRKLGTNNRLQALNRIKGNEQ